MRVPALPAHTVHSRATGRPDGLGWHTPLVPMLLALLFVLAMVAVRPMFQVSDEVSYFSGVQVGALRWAEAPPDVASGRIVPPDGETVDRFAAGKPLFRVVAGYIYWSLARVFPPADAAVALRAILGLSALVTVLFTWLIAREVAPGYPLVVAGAPLIVALHPVFVTYAAAISPDSLANASSTITLWLLVRFANASGAWWEVPLLLVFAVAAFLFKDTALFLFAGIGAAWIFRLMAVRSRRGSLVSALRHDAWLASFGLLLGLSPLILLSPRVRGLLIDSANFGRLAEQLQAGAVAVRSSAFDVLQPTNLFSTFWGALANFGGNHVFLPESLVLLLAAVCAGSTVGVLWWIVSPPRQASDDNHRRARASVLLLVFCIVVILVQTPARDLILGTEGALQGRWLFPVIGPLIVLLCLGWARVGFGGARSLPFVAFVFATLAGVALVGVIIPSFYEVFPTTYRTENLFLRGSFGRPLEMTRVEVFVGRPSWLQSWWIAATPVVTFVAAAFTWPVVAYVGLRRGERSGTVRC